MKKLIILDRDGVINKEIGQYITSVSKFQFLPGVKEAIKTLTESQFIITIATNQAGIGKGLYTDFDLLKIHSYLIKEVRKSGGNINRILYCKSSDNDNFYRKPNPGMLLDILSFYEDISPCDVFFVGDYVRDMQAAISAGCKGVFIGKKTDIDNSPKFVQKVINDNNISFSNSLNEWVKGL